MKTTDTEKALNNCKSYISKLNNGEWRDCKEIKSNVKKLRSNAAIARAMGMPELAEAYDTAAKMSEEYKNSKFAISEKLAEIILYEGLHMINVNKTKAVLKSIFNENVKKHKGSTYEFYDDEIAKQVDNISKRLETYNEADNSCDIIAEIAKVC